MMRVIMMIMRVMMMRVMKTALSPRVDNFDGQIKFNL